MIKEKYFLGKKNKTTKYNILAFCFQPADFYLKLTFESTHTFSYKMKLNMTKIYSKFVHLCDGSSVQMALTCLNAYQEHKANYSWDKRCSPLKTHTKESLAPDMTQYSMIMRSIAPRPHSYHYFKASTSVPADHLD